MSPTTYLYKREDETWRRFLERQFPWHERMAVLERFDTLYAQTRSAALTETQNERAAQDVAFLVLWEWGKVPTKEGV